MKLKDLFARILKLKTFEPNEEVNKLFSQLVELATSDQVLDKLTREETTELQQICAKAEYCLEDYWADKIISSTKPQKLFKEFPYLQNYIDLTKLEVHAIKGCTCHNEHKFIFVGGGPLPLTSIVLANKHNINSTILDVDLSAVKKSKKLINALDLHKQITVLHANGSDFDYANFNFIYVAALAGLAAGEKKAVFNRIKETADRSAHIIARSSWGNRKLLYRPVSKKIFKMFKPIIKVDPFNEIVNSIVILKNE